MKKYILLIITILIALITIISTLKLNILPTKYIIILVLIEAILTLISILQINDKKILKLIGITFSIITIALNIIGIYYIKNTNKFINKNFTGNITTTKVYYVITNKENQIDKLEDIENISYYKYSLNIEQAKKILGEYEYKELEKIEEPIKNYLLIDESNYKLLKEEYKIIYQFNIETTEPRNTKKYKSYNIFIGGRDFTRTLMDFNMILTINTKTKTILLTSIPRDYYIYIPEYNMYDSLEFMGLLGEKITINSLENLFDTKIDLYASIYTEGLVEIVDLLGGINFCSDRTFTTTHALVLDTYDDSYGEKLTIYKGCQHLNGIETLTVARERKHVGSDRQRQKNCSQIFQTIMKESLGITTLTNYEELLNKISNLYQTNIDKKTIQTLIKSLINNEYKIIEQSVDGTDGYNYIRLGTINNYVMYPIDSTVDQAKQKIKEILEK